MEQLTGGTYMKFCFVSRNQYFKKYINSEKPVGITVSFKLEPNNLRRPLPQGGLSFWSADLVKEYGDMIIIGIYASGEK